jgi:hypothetical protein
MDTRKIGGAGGAVREGAVDDAVVDDASLLRRSVRVGLTPKGLF